MSDPLLEANGVTKRFGGIQALKGIDVVQRPGELLGMIGPNGSGKSTFVNVISGALRADGGSVSLDGAPVLGLSQHHMAQAGIARTFQAVRVFHGLTVRENAVAGLLGHSVTKAEADARARDAIRRVGLEGDPDRSVDRLGLYDQRRLEFAMRLVARPKLLMLDEPVGGLNPNEIRAMISLIESLRAECGVLIIEHTMKVITALADRVVVLVNGQKLIDDAPTLVLRDKAVIETYLGTGDA